MVVVVMMVMMVMMVVVVVVVVVVTVMLKLVELRTICSLLLHWNISTFPGTIPCSWHGVMIMFSDLQSGVIIIIIVISRIFITRT